MTLIKDNEEANTQLISILKHLESLKQAQGPVSPPPQLLHIGIEAIDAYFNNLVTL